MNRKHQTINMHDKGKSLARTAACLMAGSLLFAACWALLSEGMPSGDSHPVTNGLTQQMLWNPSPK